MNFKPGSLIPSIKHDTALLPYSSQVFENKCGDLSGIEDEANQFIITNPITKETWVEYSGELYEKQDTVVIPVTPDIVINLDAVIEEKYVQNINPNDIANELLKYDGRNLESHLTALVCEILLHSRIPDEWRIIPTVLAFEKEDKRLSELIGELIFSI
ncbi:hypothetical protein JTB14_036415 [Gonioctena quinquepunctata]|nr:hypothetical protein JTB14_036415 [Gonioctena quinquepunctata]